MKKILSVILALAMVLALGVTAFAATEKREVEAGKSLTIKYDGVVPDAEEYKVVVSDNNGFVTVGTPIVGEDYIVFEVTAPAGTGEKLAKVVVLADAIKAGKKDYEIAVYEISILGEPEEEEKKVEVIKADDYGTLPDTTSIVVDMGTAKGIDAKLYNALKAKNYETITFTKVVDLEGHVASWTLTRGDYTKMNVTADILFDVRVEYRFMTADVNDVNENGNKDELVVDPTAENTVLKALDSTQADVFYVVIDDMCNIANVASKPALTIDVADEWIKYSNKFNVTGYKFNGETVAKVVENLAVKPATKKLTLNLTAGGRYVFVADNYTVNPVAPSTSEKPNASTGANSAAAVVALAVMAVAAVASKKIVK